MSTPTLADARAWDKHDPLAPLRAAFTLPAGIIYLDGNSLGPLPHQAAARLHQTIHAEWGQQLIRGWENAGWMQAPARIGAKLAQLVGAHPNEVIIADSTSINLFKILAAAAALRPGRTKILIEADNFPTDRHAAEGLARLLPHLRIVAAPAADLATALDADTAVLLLCHVHFRSGARHNMQALSEAAHQAGALALWDVSHSVGAVELALAAAGADMAVGCGYKFLNGGPGAPAFIYVAHHLQAQARSPLQGWIGHAAPFGFSDRYTPAPGMARFLTGTPPVLGLAALEAGIDLFLNVDQAAIWEKSARLFDLFAARAALLCPGLELLTPRAVSARGSHIAFAHARAADIMRLLIAGGIIGDFRPPNILRFGLTPSYTRYEDIILAVDALAAAIEESEDFAVVDG